MGLVLALFVDDCSRATAHVECVFAEEAGACVLVADEPAAVSLRGEVGLRHGAQRPDHVSVVVQPLSLQLGDFVLQLVVLRLGSLGPLECICGSVLLRLLLGVITFILIFLDAVPLDELELLFESGDLLVRLFLVEGAFGD